MRDTLSSWMFDQLLDEIVNKSTADGLRQSVCAFVAISPPSRIKIHGIITAYIPGDRTILQLLKQNGLIAFSAKKEMSE